MALVVDASAIAPLTFRDEDAGYANAVLTRIQRDGFALVPRLFWEELRNVLVVNERRGRIHPSVSDAFLAMVAERLALRAIAIDDMSVPLQLARELRLTVYDAIYLTVAITSGAELATQDKSLAAAARSRGVAVFHP